MIGITLRRIGWAVVMTWFVVTLTFVMVMGIPADPGRTMLGPHATPDAIAHAKTQYCLDESTVVQYGCWVSNVGTGDLGKSYRTDRPVTEILGSRIWPTLQLALGAIVLQLLVGIPLAIVAARRRGRWPDRVVGWFALIGQSVPTFVVGTILLYVVAYRWELLPFGGYGEGFWGRLQHLVLPSATLALVGIAYYSRVLRDELSETLAQDYVRTARAKGLPERVVIGRHALRPALPPVVTLIGLDLGVLVGGAVVTESIFAWPGLGRETLRAILDVDMPVILGIVIVTSVAVALANLAADLVQLWLDPRLRG